jgi:hypothetical protein
MDEKPRQPMMQEVCAKSVLSRWQCMLQVATSDGNVLVVGGHDSVS